MSPPEPLDADAIGAALGDQLIGNRIIVLVEATSTNDVVAHMAAHHREGLVVLAETQTAARGQYGRRWESAARQGLWLSILLRPKIAVGDSARLTDLLADAVVATIEQQTGLRCVIKPPNDVYFGPKKLAGVLVEMRVEANGGYAAIAGVGLNVHQQRDDFPAGLKESAGSMATITGRRIDRTSLAIALLRNIDVRYAAI